MSFINNLTHIAQSQPRTIVLAEGADERVVRAAEIMVAQQIAKPILTGNRESIHSIAKNQKISLCGVEIIDPANKPEQFSFYIESCANLPRPIKPALAEKFLVQPLMYGALMVRLGDADAMIAGASVKTAKVLEAGIRMIGAQSGISTASSYMLMLVPAFGNRPERALIYADCAYNIDPSPSQLAEITISSAENANRILGYKPRVALLSFSTKGSAKHPQIDKVTETLKLVRELSPEMCIDGELQFDAAFDQRTAAFKVPDPSKVAGQADVFIFPDLNAGNIGYKITQYLAGAQAIGPLLQGFAKPISDLSRGATTDDIVKTSVVLLATSAAASQ